MKIYKPASWLVSINTYQWNSNLTPVILKTFWSTYSRWEWTGNVILGGSESLAGTWVISFQVGIGSLGGTVFFQKNTCGTLYPSANYGFVINNFQNVSKYMDLILLYSLCTRTSITTNLGKDQSKIISTSWYWYVINGRKRYQRWNMSLYSSICKS